MNDHERARRLREKGWSGPSASTKAKSKGSRSEEPSEPAPEVAEEALEQSKGSRSGRHSDPAPESTEEALRNFNYNPGDGQKIRPVPRSEESKSRARSFKARLPKLG